MLNDDVDVIVLKLDYYIDNGVGTNIPFIFIHIGIINVRDLRSKIKKYHQQNMLFYCGKGFGKRLTSKYSVEICGQIS